VQCYKFLDLEVWVRIKSGPAFYTRISQVFEGHTHHGAGFVIERGKGARLVTPCWLHGALLVAPRCLASCTTVPC
jgi:hypothetical protein